MTNSLEREHVMLNQNLKKEREYQISYKGLCMTLYSDTAHPVKCGGRCLTRK
jgi:hypothetical protein